MSPGAGHLRTRNDAALERLEPFLIAPPWHVAHFDRRPFDLPIPDENVLDPTRVQTATFLDRLKTLDELTFGPEGMSMPRWVFYVCAEVPGGVFGFAARAESLPAPVRSRLGLGEGETGLVPLSMWIAIPVRPPGTWVGHNLASLNRVLPELQLTGLATITKALALKAFRCRHQVGATQWDSPALRVHSRFGSMELLTAWTPAHSMPATLTYRLELADEPLRSALGDPDVTISRPAADTEINVEDHGAMRRLQARLEDGERFAIAGPPRAAGGAITIPLSRASRRQAG
ncbi:MAG: hypothetical protein ACYTGG_01360 [Planctomycetota bacterium]